ncbi:hypothetical protein QN277_028988 [Acacia crassicarpa]|uniref:Uncharacterized protein n=1 Tax=Acacia crassicarpa TaxID=499986 RepID=A0AAE1J622_9FABA|nr:hypothetical protein QN277_028988 [Acacia crassicarpa]
MSPPTKNSDFDKLLQFLHIAILVFLNQGSSGFSNAFTQEPWSWGLSLPISLFFKFALEIHAHLGLCVGIGLPSLVYWGITRSSIDWYSDTVLDFNLDFLKSCLTNLVIGFVHWLIMKLLHKFHEWVKQNKVFSGYWPVLSKLEKFTDIFEHPMIIPSVSGKQIFVQVLEMFSVFFYNGNVMLLSWGFSGNAYDSEIGKAINWVSLGSALHVWMKACLKVLDAKKAVEEASSSPLDIDVEEKKKVLQMAMGEKADEEKEEEQLQLVNF